jgi:hypothetical protein
VGNGQFTSRQMISGTLDVSRPDPVTGRANDFVFFRSGRFSRGERAQLP